MSSGYTFAAEAPLRITSSTPEAEATRDNIEIIGRGRDIGGIGISVAEGGQAKINNATIRSTNTGMYVSGGSSYEGDGLVISDVRTGLAVSDSQAIIRNVKIIADPYEGILSNSAVRVYNKGHVSLTDFEISGKEAFSVRDGTINLTNGSLRASGAYGGSVGKSDATLDNVQMTAVTDGISMQDSTLTLKNGSTINAGLYGIVILRPNIDSTIRLEGSSVVAGSQGFRLASTGKVYAMLDNSSITARLVYDMTPIMSRPGGLFDLEAANGSVLHGAGRVADGNTANVSLSKNSFWYVNGDTSVTNLTLDETSQIIFEQNALDDKGDGFVRMVVKNDYVSNNGFVVLNAALNTNNEDSPRDHLLIEGKADGQTRVDVNNRGGLGNLTDENGINLITVNGGLGDYGADTFVMDGDYLHNGEVVVAGGAYIYRLRHTANADGADEWNLYSILEEGLEEDLGGGLGGGEDTNGGNGGGKVVYGAGVPLYEVYPQVLQRMNSLPTMLQRVGERRFVNGGADDLDNRGFWMRVEGATGHFNAARSTSRTSYDLDTVKTQMGLDFDVLETGKGQLVGGVYMQYGHGKADVFSRYGRGDIKVDAYGFGSTLTWQQDNGFYVDGQAQVQWFDSGLYSRSRNGANGFDKHLTTGNDGMGYALSLESGRKFALANGWQVTPQAQLSYSHIDFDSFRDLVNAHVKSADGNSLTGRLGLSVERTRNWQTAAGDNRMLKFYGIGNLYQEFLDGTSVKVSGVDFRHRADRTWAGVGAGVDYSWKDGAFALYGEVNAATSFKDFGDSYNLQGTLGFKAKF